MLYITIYRPENWSAKKKKWLIQIALLIITTLKAEFNLPDYQTVP